MKKLLAAILTLCLCLSLFAGCSKSDKAEKKDSSKEDKIDIAEQIGFNPEDYVTLGEYKGLESYSVTCDATDDEVEEEIESKLYDAATYTDITDRGAQKEDYITFNYSATVDGKAVEDCSYEDYEVQLGYGDFHKKLEKAMIGKKPGDTFTEEAKITEDLSSTNAGDTGVFTIEVTKLQEEHLPELNEEFVKANSNCDSIEAYRASVKEEVIANKESENFDTLSSELIAKIAEGSKFKEDYPQELYDTCMEELNTSIQENAEMFGMEAEEFMTTFYGMTEDDLEKEALNEVHSRIAIYAIAIKEKLFLTEDDYQNYVKQIAYDYGYESVDELESEFDKDTLLYQAIYDTVCEFIYDKAKKKVITQDEYDALNAEEPDEEESEETEESDEEDVTEAELFDVE